MSISFLSVRSFSFLKARRNAWFAHVLIGVLSVSLVLPPNAAAQPKPQPKPDPKPQPLPKPQPRPQPNTDAARQAGLADGRPGGDREGRERGSADGYRQGFDRSEADGYNDRLKERQRDAYNSGYGDGYRYGERRGEQEGEYQGRLEGDQRGRYDGQVDGDARARRAAYDNATPRGLEQGRTEANASDASVRGREGGLVDGDLAAHRKAEEVDFARGQKDIRNEKYAESIENHDEFSQKGARPSSHIPFRATTFLRAGMQPDAAAGPDYRYLSCPRAFANPQEQSAYTSACREGYGTGFSSSYNAAFRDAEQNGNREGRDRGRQRADRVDTRSDFESGKLAGDREGYRRAFDRARDLAYRLTYPYAFQTASASAYTDAYQPYWEQAFAAGRASGYKERYQDLFTQAYNTAYTEKLQSAYPEYARAAYQEGRDTEAREFELNPLRLNDATLTKEFASGIYEPGEALRFQVEVRNFSAREIQPQDVEFTLEALNPRSAALTEPRVLAVRSFRPKSTTQVRDTLEFRMGETSVGQSHDFVLRLKYQGRLVGQKSVSVSPRFMLGMELSASPTLREGIETTISVRVKNQSQLATDAGAKVQFLARSDALEILEPEVLLGVLPPGQSRLVSFRVIGKKSGEWVRIPMAFLALQGDGRRVGVYDVTDEVPIVNDYSIKILEGLPSLKNEGTTRIEYRVENQNSRLVLRSLQLHVRVKRDDTTVSEQHVILGPNPQYLTPIMSGHAREFLVPILVKKSVPSSFLELEVQEEGQTVVIHREVISP